MEPERSPIARALPSRSERGWVLVFAMVVMLVTTVPYPLGYAVQGEGWRFTGFVFSVEDGNAFIGKMLSGAAGDWLFRTPYTAFPQRGFLIFLPYILLGKLVSPLGTHEQLVALYHLFRVCAGVLAILATYDFLSLFILGVRYRRLGLVLATLGTGLGWLLVLLRRQNWLGALPLDFYSPETFGFLSLYVYPHYALARALLLWGLVAYLRGTTRIAETPSIAVKGLKVGVLWLLTALAQPLTGMVVGAVVAIYLFALAVWQACLALEKKQTDWPKLWGMTRLAVWAGILPAPFVLYNLISTQADPFLKLWTEQSPFVSPHPLHYLLAYGLMLPFALMGAKHLWLSKDWVARFPILWALLLPILAYAPVGIQRRLPEGIWVALVVLAMKALEMAQDARVRTAGALLLFAFPSTALLLVGGALLVMHPAQPLFRPSDEVAVFRYLAEHADRQAVVLSSYETGNALPAWAPVFVVVGHGPESVGLAELMPRVEAFYRSDTSEDEKIELLRELDVEYVFWGPSEQVLGGWDPKTAGFLSPFYRQGDYWIFAVHE